MDSHKKDIYFEIGLILIGAIAVFFISSHYDLLESAFEFTRKYENYELDEILPTSLFLVIVTIPFLIRRWKISYKKNKELQEALNEIKVLKGILPICSSCKDIRDEEGQWHRLETYIQDNTQSDFTHGICPKCIIKLYPNTKAAKRHLAQLKASKKIIT